MFNHSLAQSPKKDNDLKCFDEGAYRTLDLLETTRSYGGYDADNEWSQNISSTQIIKKMVELDGGRQYVILLATEKPIDAAAIEIRDQFGIQQEYIYKISELDRDQINLFYTPISDGIYQILFRVINSKNLSPCTYMAVLKGEMDPEYISGKEISTQEEEY